MYPNPAAAYQPQAPVFETFGEYANPPAHTDRLRDLLVGADGRFPVVYSPDASAGHFTRIEEVRRAEIEIDTADRLTNAAAHRDFRSRLRRQFDAGYRNPGVELRERRFDGGTDCRLVIRECSAAIDIVGCEPAAEVEFKLVRCAI